MDVSYIGTTHFCRLTHSKIWQKRNSTVAGQSDLRERKNVTELCLQPSSCCFLTWSTLWPWQWRQHIPLECQWTSTKLCGVTYEMTVLFTGSVYHSILLVFTWLTYQSQRWKQHARLKCPTSIRLLGGGFTSQKVVFFISNMKVPIQTYLTCFLHGNPE